MPFGRPISTLEQRLAWLRAHAALWQDMKLRALPGGTYRFFLDREDHKKVFRAMQADGLFSKSTYPLDIKDSEVHTHVARVTLMAYLDAKKVLNFVALLYKEEAASGQPVDAKMLAFTAVVKWDAKLRADFTTGMTAEPGDAL